MEGAKWHNSKLCHYLCFLICLSGVLFVVSKNSFLYEFNDTEDANCFYLVARYLLDGKILYRDFFEQKGPIIYFINVIGQILTPKAFHGVYLLEIAAGFFYFEYAYKTLECLSSDVKRNLIITTVGCLSSYAIPMFGGGGEVEEFALPLFAFLTYQIIRSMTTGNKISRLALFSIGFQAGLIFWSKYFVLLFYVVALLFYGIYCLRKNSAKWIIDLCLYIGLGFLAIGVMMVLYFVKTDSLESMVMVYFVQNIFAYTPSYERVGLFRKLIQHTSTLFVGLGFSVVYVLLFFIALSDVTNPGRKDKRTAAKMFSVVVTSTIVLLLVFCGMSIPYYYIPCTALNFLCLHFLFDWTQEFAGKKQKLARIGLMLASVFPLAAFLVYMMLSLDEYDETVLMTKTVTGIIEEQGYENVYVFNGMDAGFFYNLDYLPDRYYFIETNSNSEYVAMKYWQAVVNGEADFVIMKLNEPMLEHVDDLDDAYVDYGYAMLFEGPMNSDGIAIRLYGQK